MLGNPHAFASPNRHLQGSRRRKSIHTRAKVGIRSPNRAWPDPGGTSDQTVANPYKGTAQPDRDPSDVLTGAGFARLVRVEQEPTAPRHQ